MPWERTGSGYTTKKRGGFVRNPEQYEKLRAKGMSKERAAAITNSVSKSLINGKFVPISQLPKAERRMVGGYRTLKGIAPEHEEYLARRSNPENKRFYNRIRRATPDKSQRESRILRSVADSQGVGGFTVRQGGKNTGKSGVYINTKTIKDVHPTRSSGRSAAEHVWRHELQHANPKRSEYRLHGQLQVNPYKSGMEEGRADYLASGHHADPGMVAGKMPKSWGGGDIPKSGYPAMAANEKMVIGEHAAPKSTFHQGYYDIQDKLRAKGVKPARNNIKKSYEGAVMVENPLHESTFSLDRRDAVAKAWDKAEKRTTGGNLIAGAVGAGPVGSAIGASSSAKKGKRWSTGWRAGGRSFGEGVGGGVAGAAVGSGIGLLTRKASGVRAGTQIGGALGSTTGGIHGGYTSVGNSRRKGWLKRGH